MRKRTLVLVAAVPALVLLAVGRSRAGTPPPPPAPSVPVPLLPPRQGLPPERRALMLVGGEERIVDAVEAQAAGMTLVDLADTWTPYLFDDATNHYRNIFLGLANDTGDADGQPLPKNAHNHLEVYGIVPSLSVLRARFLADEAGCPAVDYGKLHAVKSVPTIDGAKKQAKEDERVAGLERRLAAAQQKAGVTSLEALAQKQPNLAADVASLTVARARRAAFAEAEKRLACEKLFPRSPKHKPGHFDDAFEQALVEFQLENKIFDSAALRPETVLALGRPPLENDFAALQRVLAERVVAAHDVLEDGTVDAKDGRPPMYRGADGAMHPVRNLVDEDVQAVLAQLGLTSPETALAFFERHPAAEFKWLRAAIQLPKLPEYYSGDMDLSVEIDRGDVIYDPPFDEKGKPCPFYRTHFPSLTVRVKYLGQTIPLVRWRTTIGGWRSDQASNGYEYWRYKGSDVGPRVWRNVVAGPVWIAPVSTPIRTLVKQKTVNNNWQTVVNYDELGPGYLSAYGLVAAYNVIAHNDGRADEDNGIRVHGSSEYRSIRNPDGYSHGCHRLVNNLAIRMFSFALQHRPVKIVGDRKLGFSRQFLWKDEEYELRMPSRGFWYEFVTPVPVNVLEGNIVGKVKKPILGYVPKADVQYPPGPIPTPPDLPESRAGGDE